MCDGCDQLDEKIEHYKKVMSAMTDQLTIDGITALVAELQAQKRRQPGTEMSHATRDPVLLQSSAGKEALAARGLLLYFRVIAQEKIRNKNKGQSGRTAQTMSSCFFVTAV